MKYAIIILLFLFAGCQKEIRWPEEQLEKPKPQPCDCYVSKKLVRQDTVLIFGKTLTRYDVDTCHYLRADCKIIGPDSLINYMAVLNLKPYEYCEPKFNYATLKVFGNYAIKYNGDSLYLWKILTINNDTVFIQVNQHYYNQNNRLVDKFMYN